MTVFLVAGGVLSAASAAEVPLDVSEMDYRIEMAAKRSYVFKTYLKDDTIDVKSKDGIVSLTGTVDEKTDRILAEEIVANLPGVREVENRLEVKKEIPRKYSFDGWIGMKIKTALLFRWNVSAFKTQVEVEDGVVTLRGKADSAAQKDLTTQYARDVNGVKGVINEMTVVERKP